MSFISRNSCYLTRHNWVIFLGWWNNLSTDISCNRYSNLQPSYRSGYISKRITKGFSTRMLILHEMNISYVKSTIKWIREWFSESSLIVLHSVSIFNLKLLLKTVYNQDYLFVENSKIILLANHSKMTEI